MNALSHPRSPTLMIKGIMNHVGPEVLYMSTVSTLNFLPKDVHSLHKSVYKHAHAVPRDCFICSGHYGGFPFNSSPSLFSSLLIKTIFSWNDVWFKTLCLLVGLILEYESVCHFNQKWVFFAVVDAIIQDFFPVIQKAVFDALCLWQTLHNAVNVDPCDLWSRGPQV